MNEDDEEVEEEVLEVSSSPSSSSKNNRAAACCMVYASRIKLSIAPTNLSETTITVASSSPIAAIFFFFFFFLQRRKGETFRSFLPPPTQGNSSNSSSSAPTLAEPSKPLAQNACKTLPNFIFLGFSSSYGALHFPRSLYRAGFAARINKSVPVMRDSPFLLSKPYYLMWLCCYCFCNVLDLPIMCCSYKLAFRCCIQAAMKDEQQEVPRIFRSLQENHQKLGLKFAPATYHPLRPTSFHFFGPT